MQGPSMSAMTCDEVFDLLTGQPHNGEAQRDALFRHLSGCRSCRRLADALEPAVELFRECAAGEARSSSASIRGPWNDTEVSRADWSVLSAAPSATPWMWQL